MILSRKGLKDKRSWERAGIELPKFDMELVAENTTKHPQWVHFGAGNIFRGFIANAHQKLLDEGYAETGIIAVDSFDYEIIDRIYKPYDNLSLLVLMSANGDFQKKVIGSITESIAADYERASSFEQLISIFENPSLQMVSFTITEKGYALKNTVGEYFGVIEHDIEAGPDKALHSMSMITALLYKRFLKNQAPVTMVSMDNCSHNGDKLKAAVLDIAGQWVVKGFVGKTFVEYLTDEKSVTFPLSMIDKITPRPADLVHEHLKGLGIEDISPIITTKNSYMAPYINAELSDYLVIEDKFVNGRPALEKAGVIFTDRETVNKVETMKVTTCLNPLHTALAVSGSLLGFTSIAEQVRDPQMAELIRRIGYDEGLPVVVDPGIIDPKTFIDEVIHERFANPNIPDTPQRIATDTSQKVGIRFGKTIASYVERPDLDPKTLIAIPLAIALWCRYLLAIDDKGDEFELSPDPLMEALQKSVEGIVIGGDTIGNVREILSNENLFGLNLYDIGLGEKIERMVAKMTKGPGAVRKTLNEYLV